MTIASSDVTDATLLSTGFSWLASDWKLTKEMCIFNVIQKDALLCNLLSVLTVFSHSLLCVTATSRRRLGYNVKCDDGFEVFGSVVCRPVILIVFIVEVGWM